MDDHRLSPPRPLGRGADARIAYARVALREDRLRLVAQPILDLHTGNQVAHELLLRFCQRGGKLDLPEPYVRAAECYRLAIDLDAWVLERAARLAATGRRVHVNLSGRTLVDEDFADRIETTLARHRADPALFVFEIPETARGLDLPHGCLVAERIKDLGAGLAVDDFGTGYGSLDHLLRMPVTMLKIDRRLVAQVIHDIRARVLLGSIVTMTRRLGLTAVAQGVEDATTLATLRECGVQLAQGFHVGAPEPL
jgi:EAL domain-containing protein (putative c-di-GMP-specific phosphodiesterase class I)